MARGPLAGLIPRMPLAALGGHAAGDAELLARFLAARDGDAFELLVRRHGPMVLAVCLRVLRNRADAEDAFQATFLVLAHKAATVSPPGRLAGWLHGVAHKTALKARHRAARRAAAERLAPARSTPPMPPESDWDEVEPLLDQELAALPERYRLPIVLCDLEGRRRTEVAATLGCAEGTLSARLTRGRRLLADRLRRRGVLLSVAALAGVLAGRSAALAEPLVRVTVPAALHAVSASGTAAGAASPSVAELATGVMKSMFLKKLQAVAVVALVAAAALAALAGLGADRSSAAPAAKAAPVPVPAAADDKATIEALADMDGQLLINRKVLKDLKCDFDQFDKIMDVMEAAQKRAQDKTSEAMAQFRANPAAGPNPEGFRKMVAEAQEVGAKELNKAAVGVVADLTPAQRKRLREIDLQARGHEAFTTSAVAKALDLNSKQKEQVAANAKQVEEDVARANQRPAPVGGPGAPGRVATASFNSADSEKAVRDARAEGLKRAMAVLTDEQKTAWKKLTGEPFAHPLDRPARSGGGSGGGVFKGGAAPAPPVPPAGPGAPGAPGKVPPPVNPPAVDPGN